MSITYELVDENIELLHEQLAAAFDGVQKLYDPQRVIVHDPTATQGAVDAIILSHDNSQSSTEQAANAIESGSLSQASNIPGWASWTETQALDWHDTNIGDNLPVANLAAANLVLADMATAQRNLIRMVIALRNKNFPNLQG